MEFHELQIPPPRYWQQFEDLCLSIFREVWGDPTAQKNGRAGQPQNGTDISGRANGAAVGVQCKGKDVGLGATLTEDEVRTEVEKAKGFKPPLATWILATTAPKDARIEEIARQITVEHQANGLFEVRVFGWEDLLSLMTQSVIERHYAHLVREVPVNLAGDLTDAIRAAREAARRDLENFQQADGGAKSVYLTLEKDTKDGPVPFGHADAGGELRSGKPLLLEAEPGAGKSTTLIQLTGSLLAESNDCVAVIVLLPELGQMRRGLIDEIAGRPTFRGVTADTLSNIAQAGLLVLLCDGWNEISAEQRDWVRTGLARFRRDYPGSGLVVATRALSPPPMQGAVRIFVRPPSRAQQLAILSETVGRAGDELLNRARRTPGLSDLLRTPLYLAVLGEIGSGGGLLPETKEQAIRRFIERQEQRSEQRSILSAQLRDCHQEYLRAAACRLTISGAGVITQSDLRNEIAQVSEKLKQAGQITTVPEQQSAIDTLVSHHVLVERPGETGKPFYSFQHPQFQEWFASFHVEGRIVAASASSSPENAQRLAEILNQADWTEATLFAVERLSRVDANGARSVRQAICLATTIDPMLGAAMIRRAAPATWDHIAEPIVRFATNWHKTEENHRAFRFMIGSGRWEFAAPVWETIASKDGYDRSANFEFGWFAPSVLGPRAFDEYAKLPDGQRRSLLWDLMRFGGQEGIDFALEACPSEPSAEVVRTVLDLLWFGGANSEFETLLPSASPEVWKLLATHHRLFDTDGAFRTRLLEEKRKLAAAASAVDKLRILMELAEQGEYDNPDELIRLAFEVKPTDYQSEYSIFTPLASKFPEQLSQSIIERLLCGDTVPAFASRFVGVAGVEHQEALREIALGTRASDIAKEAAARALNLESARSLIQDLFAVLDELAANTGTSANEVRQKYQTITGALHLLHDTVLTPSLLASDASEPRHIAALAELLFRWRSDDRETEALPVYEAARGALVQALDNWTSQIVGNPKTTRHDLSNLVTAIKRAAAPSLLLAFKRLLDADLDGWRREQAELGRLRQQRRPTTWISVGYMAIYRHAIEAFQGDAVRDLLLTYIGNPDFEVEAAFALRQYGTNDRIPSPAEGFGRPKYGEILPARERRTEDQRAVSAVAGVLLDRIDVLLQTGRADDFGRAIGLATAAAQMDYGDRVQTINAVLSAPGPMSPRYGLLLVLPFAGEILPAAYVRQGYDEAMSSFLGQKWHNQNEWWVIDRWIELMALSDTPEFIIDCVEKLPDQFKHAHYFDRILYALGYSDPARALNLLNALASLIPDIATAHNYIEACAQIGSMEATRHLLTVACNPPSGASHHHDWLGLSNVLSVLLGKHPSIRRELMARAADDRGFAAYPVIARLLPSIIGPEDVLTLLRAWNPQRPDHASQVLEHAVHNLAYEDRPIAGTGGVFEREPSDLSLLRAELFRIYADDEPQAAFAAGLLRIIDRQRDTYGRPLSEPRHPNLALGVPWPREAAGLAFL